MKIAIASDHAGRNLRRKIKSHLAARGHEVVDLGPESSDPVDYPDYAVQAARQVAGGKAERGVLVCGSGMGMMLSANKVPGILAVVPHTEDEARLSRAHNNTNVACFGERTQDPEQVLQLLDLWLATPFEGGRHARRVEKIHKIEESRQGGEK
ncbi:MAG: ribose 5-phosphate isomerase B [Planctomycetes bacterium]|nr:ribose 5-phosphate isomerase B [Planctomycetota bacterium]